jgi:hypothetical protein
VRDLCETSLEEQSAGIADLNRKTSISNAGSRRERTMQQASARSHCYLLCRSWKHRRRNRKNGRGGEIRTHDLYVPNVALYQAKLRPDIFAPTACAAESLKEP